MILDQITELLKFIKERSIKPIIYHFSRESNVGEYGEEVWGAKKHIVGFKKLLDESLEEIEEKGDNYAIDKINKKSLVPKFDIQEQIDKGKSAGHIYFSKYIIDSIPTKPITPESETYRESYYIEIANILLIIEETFSTADLFFRLRGKFRLTEKLAQEKYENDLKRYNEKERKDVWDKPPIYEVSIKNHIIYHKVRTYTNIKYSMSGKYANAISLGDYIPYNKANAVRDREYQAERLENGGEIRIDVNTDYITLNLTDKKIKKSGFINIKKSTKTDYDNLLEVLSPKKIITSEQTIGDSLKERYIKLLEKYGNLQEDRFPYLSESGEIAVIRLGEDFKFRGIQFGNYVSDRDRIVHTKLVYGSFFDLAEILGMNPEDIGLERKLAISIGSRGSGRSKAHYEKKQKIINLTKTRGNGSIAHEYAHALDNILFTALEQYNNFTSSLSKEFTQYNRKYRELTYPKEKIDDIYDDTVANYISYHYSFNKLEKDISRNILISFYNIVAYIRESGFRYRSLKEGTYWGNKEELFARAFESYIFDKLEEKKIENFYLVFSTKGDPRKKEFSIYPQGEEREDLNKLFDTFFELMKPNWNKLW